MTTTATKKSLPDMVWTYDQYSDPSFAKRIIAQHLDHGYVILELADLEDGIEVPARLALLNIVFWGPFFKYNIHPEKKNFLRIESLAAADISSVYSLVYEQLLDTYPEMDNMEFVQAIFDNLDDLEALIVLHMAEYMPTVDNLAFAQIMDHPIVKQINSFSFNDDEGTKVAEAKIKTVSEQFINVLKDPNKIVGNPILPLMLARVLKPNQVPQLLLTYGGRSDIDDRIMHHIIRSSSFEGLHGVEDYAVESLAAAKAIFYHQGTVSDVSYGGRKVSLSTSRLEKIHTDDCGAHQTIQFTIPAKFKDNFIQKIIQEDDGRYVVLTKKNIDQYVNRPIQMLSPLACRHKDGICEFCAGYGKFRLHKYLPPEIHIGIFAATMYMSSVEQKILSAKHIIKTNSLVYALPDESHKFFMVKNNEVFFTPESARQCSKWKMTVNLDFMGQVNDIMGRVMPNPNHFSKLEYITLSNEDGNSVAIPLLFDQFTPFLTNEMLHHFKSVYKKWEIKDTTITIPLAGFNTKFPVFKCQVVNDDMIAYSNKLLSFLSSSMVDYTNCSEILRDFTNIVFQKIDIPVFYLELILKAFMIKAPDVYEPGDMQPDGTAYFGNMESVISNSTITEALAFEDQKNRFLSVMFTLLAKPLGLYAPLFGMI